MNIYVGNFSSEITEDDLRTAFQAYGEVASAVIIKDKFTGEPRGFGFVEMPSKKEAEAAIDGIKQLKGRMVVVNEARPKAPKAGGFKQRGGFNRRERRY